MIHPPSPVAGAPVPLDAQRQLYIEAFISLMDRALFAPDQTLPGGAARAVLARLERAGLAAVQRGGDTRHMTLLGITGSTTGHSDYALLQNWKSAARARMEGAPQ